MKKFQLKKLAMALVVIMFGVQAFAQGRIDLASRGTSSQKAENATMSGFTASFSYNSVESELVSTEKGDFSVITMNNMQNGKSVDVCFYLEENTFRGRTTLQMNAQDIKLNE